MREREGGERETDRQRQRFFQRQSDRETERQAESDRDVNTELKQKEKSFWEKQPVKLTDVGSNIYHVVFLHHFVLIYAKYLLQNMLR